MSDTLHVVCPHCDRTNRLPAARLTEAPNCGACHEALFTGHPVALDDARFARHVSNSDLPLVVDFWAPWCGPCRSMAPAFEQAAAALEPAVRLAKINTDEAQAVAGRYGIRSIPTLIVFRGGQEIARQSGAMPAAALGEWIKRACQI